MESRLIRGYFLLENVMKSLYVLTKVRNGYAHSHAPINDIEKGKMRSWITY